MRHTDLFVAVPSTSKTALNFLAELPNVVGMPRRWQPFQFDWVVQTRLDFFHHATNASFSSSSNGSIPSPNSCHIFPSPPWASKGL